MSLKLALCAVALIAAALCSFGCRAEPERLSVAEYAEFCSDGIVWAATLIEPEALTWGGLLELAEPSLARLQAVTPPEVIEDFHNASIRVLEFIIDTAEDEPATQEASPLAFGFQAISVATRLTRALDALPAEVRQTLDAAGCLGGAVRDAPADAAR